MRRGVSSTEKSRMGRRRRVPSLETFKVRLDEALSNLI